jgi:energy-coupling factor transporter ATP-binding protein EcfA2
MPEETPGLHVLRHIVDHYKILSAVNITPDGTFNLIQGKNGQGKTSLLESIQVALMGPAAAPDMPVTAGESKCVLVTEIGSDHKLEFTVKRTFTVRGGHQLEVTTEAGIIKSPQAFIDALLGDLCFDPLKFMRTDAKQQANRLMEALGLDPTALEQKKRELTDLRLMKGRDARELQARLKGLPTPKVKPTEPLLNMDEIKEKGRAIIAQVEAAQALDNRISTLVADETLRARQIAQEQKIVADLRNQIEKREELIREMEGYSEKNAEQQRHATEKRTAMVVPPLEQLQEDIGQAEAHNRDVEAARYYDETRKRAETEKKKYEELTREIEIVEAAKAAAIKKANFPLPDLTFAQDELQLHGIPLKQCSISEQLRASIAIAMALNPRARILLIEDGSLLDSDTKLEVVQMARDKGFQVFMEQVAESGTVGFIVTDGDVVTAQEPSTSIFKDA